MKPRKPSPPSWPRTPDQRAQSRPVIVMRPVRLILSRLPKGTPAHVIRDERKYLSSLPKGVLDRMAMEP